MGIIGKVFKREKLRWRAEPFGGIIALNNPPAAVYVDRAMMQTLGVAESPLWAGWETTLTAPVTAHLNLTQRCPMQCRTCYNNSGQNNPVELSPDRVKTILETLAGMKVFTVAFGGGEPLAHPAIFELAAYARKLGITPTTTTNGYPVDRTVAKRCRVFSHVHVSLDGVGPTYQAVRGVDGFHHAGRAIELFKQEGVSVGINCVLCRINYDHLEELAGYITARGVNDVIFLRLKPGGRARNNYESMRLTLEQRREFFPRLEALTQKYNLKPHIDCAMMPFIYWHHPNRETLDLWAGDGCVAAIEIAEIRPDGLTAACSFSAVTAGRAEDLAHNWYSPGLQQLRSWVSRAPEPCRSCRYLDLCRGGCRALAATLTGDPDAPDPECPFIDGGYKDETR